MITILLKSLNRSHLLFTLILLFITVNVSYAQRFSISGTKINDINGTEFVPIGANVSGWNYHDWVHNAVADVDVLSQAWKFNIVRANIHLKATSWNGVLTNGGKTWRHNINECTTALDAIVNQFTAKKIVVMLEVHDWTCSYPTTADDIQLLYDFWSWAANRYKGNTYVWFNIMNEPQWDNNNGYASYSWVTTHRPIIQLIRDQIAADNIIIIDGVNCGQETQTWNNNPIPASQSAIITYGNDLKYFNNKTYNNIGFNFHMYGYWGLNFTKSDTKLTDFITRIHNLGHCIFIGEVGATGLADSDNVENVGSAYRAALLGKRVGMLAWHWSPKDGFKLTEAGSGAAINSWTNPTNLSTWAGKYFWDATHRDGFGLSSSIIGTPDTQPPTAPSNLVSTGSTAESVSLSWSASTDNVGVVGYNVYRGTALVGTTISLFFTVTGLSKGKSYTFTVKAKDAVGNLSLSSNTVTVKTPRATARLTNGDLVINSKFTETISVYPNPSQGQFVVNYISPINQSVVVQIVDMNGNILLSNSKQVNKGNNTISLTANKGKTGLYYINLIPSLSKKIIVTKIRIN